PVYTVDVSGRFANPVPVALADGFGGPAAWTPAGAAAILGGRDDVSTDGPNGHAGLLLAPLDPAGEVSDLAGSLDRNVMPGGPGYPGGRPALIDAGATVVFCVRDRGCSHAYAVPADGSASPRPVVAGPGRVVSGLSVASGTGIPGGGSVAAVVLATPTSYGEVVAVDLVTGAETVLTAHGSGRGEEEAEL